MSHTRPKEGDVVIATNTDETTLKGRVVDVHDTRVVEWELQDDQTLYDYWIEQGVNIDPNQKVITVNAKGSGQVYDFPENKVVPADVVKDDDVVMKDPNELVEIIECPNCGNTFPENNPDAVDGDGDDVFCSIECLRVEYS